jgi:hypothetical protein
MDKAIEKKIGSINEMLPIVKQSGESPATVQHNFTYPIEVIKPIEASNGIVYITYSETRNGFGKGIEQFKLEKSNGGECDYCGFCPDCEYGDVEYLNYHLDTIHKAFTIAIKRSNIKY